MTTAAAALFAFMMSIAERGDVRAPERAANLAPILIEEGIAGEVDPRLLAALAYVESRWNPRDRGPAGEIGVLQLHPKGMALFLCRGMVVSRMHENVRCAIRILKYAQWRCGGDLAAGLSAYNGRFCRASTYSDKVLALYRRR